MARIGKFIEMGSKSVLPMGCEERGLGSDC